MSGNVCWLLTLPCVLLALLLIGAPDRPALQRALDRLFAPDAPSRLPLAEADGQVQLPVPSAPAAPAATGRGVILPLYVSFAALQALDVHSTMTALNRGHAAEGNPLMAGVVGKPAAFIALKAATSAGVIYLTERVRKRSRTGALVMMAAFNSAYATIVARNYRMARR